MTAKKPRPKWQIVYDAMANGKEIKFPTGCVYTVIDSKLYIRLEYYNSGSSLDGPPDETVWDVSDMHFNHFINECEKFSEEDMLGFVFTNAMNRMNKR